jgi:hypothetical protein
MFRHTLDKQRINALLSEEFLKKEDAMKTKNEKTFFSVLVLLFVTQILGCIDLGFVNNATSRSSLVYLDIDGCVLFEDSSRSNERFKFLYFSIIDSANARLRCHDFTQVISCPNQKQFVFNNGLLEILGGQVYAVNTRTDQHVISTSFETVGVRIYCR